MLLLQSSRAVTARLKRESGRDLSGCQDGSALTPYCNPVAVSLGTKRRPYSGEMLGCRALRKDSVSLLCGLAIYLAPVAV